MKKIAYIILICFVFFSCKKEEMKMIEPLIENRINYYEIGSIVEGNVHQTNEIDYNDDGIVDFYLESNEEEELFCGTGLDSNYTGTNSYTYYLHGISFSDQIFKGNLSNLESKASDNSLWVNNSYSFHLNVNPKVFTEKYFVFKKMIDNKTYYGWFKLQTDFNKTEFVELAINSLPDFDIKVGQKE